MDLLLTLDPFSVALGLLLGLAPAVVVTLLAQWGRTRPGGPSPWLPALLGVAGVTLGIAAVLATLALHAEWIAARRDAARGALNGDVWAVVVLVMASVLPTMGVLLWLAAGGGQRRSSAAEPNPLQPATVAAVYIATLCSMGLSLALSSVFPAAWAGVRISAVGLGVGMLYVLGPLLLRVLARPSEAPGDGVRLAEARRVLEEAGIVDARFSVVETRGRWANALAVGVVPGRSRVVLTRPLVDTLKPRELAAVTAHEAGHVRGHHVAALMGVSVLLSVGAGAGQRLLLGSIGDASLPVTGAALAVSGTVLVLGMPLALAAVSRHLERRADLYAARMGLGAALADALVALRSANAWADPRGPERWLALHPPVDERVRALRSAAG